MKENTTTPNPQEEQNKQEEKPSKDKVITGHTDVKNAHASGLGSMGRHDEEDDGPGKTEKD